MDGDLVQAVRAYVFVDMDEEADSRPGVQECRTSRTLKNLPGELLHYCFNQAVGSGGCHWICGVQEHTLLALIQRTGSCCCYQYKCFLVLIKTISEPWNMNLASPCQNCLDSPSPSVWPHLGTGVLEGDLPAKGRQWSLDYMTCQFVGTIEKYGSKDF
jgi:hypothetical protein